MPLATGPTSRVYFSQRLRLHYVEVPCTITYTEYSRAKGQRLSGSFAILADLYLRRLYK